MNRKSGSESWWAYRYNLKEPVLKAPVTPLDVAWDGRQAWAYFDLIGWNQPVEVRMIDDGSTGWYGDHESFGFRWTRVEPDGARLGPDALVGQVLDRNDPNNRRDFFVAVRSKREIQLPSPENGVYDFGHSLLTPFEKTERPIQSMGDISVSESEINFHGHIYKPVESTPYENGLKLTGWHNGAYKESLELWIPPVDATGHLLAVGCHSHWTSDQVQSVRPIDPTCVNGAHLR